MLEHYTTMMQNPLGAVKDIAVSSAIATGPPMIAAFRQAANNNVGEGLISVKQESKLMEGVCANCGNSISDKYRLRVDERDYHESCLSCAECSMPLSHRCYSRDCKFYCRADYQRIYAAKCQRCQQRVDSNEMVMRLPDRSVFHVDCFVCYVCGELLMRGMPYIVRHGQPLCKREFPTADMYNMNNSPQDDDLLDDTRPRDGRRGPKRPRTILTSVQRRQFKASFELSPKPCRKVREALAKDTGLSVRVVQVWFQNQRAKMKKLQRKAKTEPGSEKEPKEERKPESPHSDHSHYMNALNMRDGESSNFPSATQPLNPNNPYSPDDAYPGHSGESFCSSDISIDGTEAGFEIGESESGGPGGPDGSHGGSSHSHHGGSGPGASGTAAGGPGGGPNPEQMPSLAQAFHPAMHNPIDKLCMMQTSYFSGADHP